MTTKKEPDNDGSNTIIRLLLHTVDGAIPYLTPHLLEECFPVSKVKEYLWLGISVRDTCITPVVKVAKDEEEDEDNEGVVECDHKKTKTNNNKKKKKKRKNHPSGYTFSDDITLDPWLLKYTRITVPTLDPYEDAKQFSYQKVANSATMMAASSSSSSGSGGGTTCDHVMVWTDNGRQKLSNQLYCGASKSLQSYASVTLFDVYAPDAKEKRRKTAFQRTNQWQKKESLSSSLISSSSASTTTTSTGGDIISGSSSPVQQRKVWVACLVTNDDDSSSVVVAKQKGNNNNHRSSSEEDPEIEQQFATIRQAIVQQQQQQQRNANESNRVNDDGINDVIVDGIAFVGPAAGSAKPLQKAIQKLQQQTGGCSKTTATTTTTPSMIKLPNLSVLSTNSLTQFLDCYQAGIHIIGSNLPATWARCHKALVCDIWHWRTDGDEREQDDDNPSSSSTTNKNRQSSSKLEEEMMDEDCCYRVTEEWIRDKRPIMEGCSCLTCQQHSRAYLYHLVMTKELLSGILLFIHNLTHMLALCEELSNAKKEGREEVIVNHIKKQMMPADSDNKALL